MRNYISAIVIIFSSTHLYSQETLVKVDTILYKKIDTINLIMKVVYPPSKDKSTPLPAMIFFFGGGWKTGSIKQFELHANYFAQRGIVCFLAEYRIASKHGTYIKEAIMDAKSAVRYIRANAIRFNIDENKIIASGGSAGGHLAAATVMIREYDDKNDNASVSSVPNALVLFNPALDLFQMPEPREKMSKTLAKISPLQNMRKGLPPTIIFHGEEDELVPVKSILQFQTEAQKLGNRCELKVYKGEKHGFFNFSRSKLNYRKTVFEADEFLFSLGYLDGMPTLMSK